MTGNEGERTIEPAENDEVPSSQTTLDAAINRLVNRLFALDDHRADAARQRAAITSILEAARPLDEEATRRLRTIHGLLERLDGLLDELATETGNAIASGGRVADQLHRGDEID